MKQSKVRGVKLSHEHVTRQHRLKQLNDVRRRAKRAWLRSTSNGAVGNPRYLMLMLRCTEARCELLGLYPGGAPVSNSRMTR